MAGHWLELDNAVCVVTGGTGGIGRSIVNTLADAGGRMVILDRDEAAVRQFAAEVGRGALGMACDIASEASLLAARDAVDQAFGRCDVLVNNAAVLTPRSLLDASLDEWNRRFCRVSGKGAC